MDRMAANWQNSMSDLALVRTREAEYLEEYRRVGAKRFEEAVGRCLRHHATGFHPTLGEFLAYVPEPEDKTLDQKMAQWKAEYEKSQEDPEYQRELQLLHEKLRQLGGRR